MGRRVACFASSAPPLLAVASRTLRRLLHGAALLDTPLSSRIAYAKRECSAKVVDSPEVNAVNVRYERGLPLISVPLPSRKEICQFSLRPLGDTVAAFCENLSAEDRGIDFVALYTRNGSRIAGSTSVEHLLQFGDFRLRVNDTLYTVVVPAFETEMSSLVELSTEKMKDINDMRATVASLHALLNVDEFKLERERQLLRKLEETELELKPLEEVKAIIDAECESRSERVMWTIFAGMSLQAGLFARLTWWEYSWDIMEPVTYFATYATVIFSYGYYLYTRQACEYPGMKSRFYTNYFHKRALKYKFDVARYNELQNLMAAVRHDLERLRDPLYQHLPASRLSWLLYSKPAKEDPSSKRSAETDSFAKNV